MFDGTRSGRMHWIAFTDTASLSCSDRVLLIQLPLLTCMVAAVKRTPHLISEEVFLATNLSTNIERNPTVSDSVHWINADRPNGSHSECTETDYSALPRRKP